MRGQYDKQRRKTADKHWGPKFHYSARVNMAFPTRSIITKLLVEYVEEPNGG
jgi:hypothetical protein